MNRLEAAYAALLRSRQLSGEIAFWAYEAVHLKLAERTFYTPDFLVMLPDGHLEFHETKGFMRDDAAVKIKVAASRFWFTPFILVRRNKGVWTYDRIPNGVEDREKKDGVEATIIDQRCVII